MTMKQAQFNALLQQHESAGLFAKAQTLVSSALQRFGQENDMRQAIWELEQLDDRALQDIGISRCQIEARVRGRR